MDPTSTTGLTPAEEQANFNSLVIDVAWFGLAFASTSRFLSVYAIRLGATSTDLSLLASLPAIAMMISTSLAGWWSKRYADPVKANLWPGIGFRLAFLFPVFIPLLPPAIQLPGLIALATLPQLGQGMGATIFVVMMRQAIPMRRMTALLSQRMLVFNACVGIGVLAYGFFLERTTFPVNYQAMFGLSFLLSMGSMWRVMAVKLPPRPPMPATHSTAPKSSPWRTPSFQRVAFIAAIIHVAFVAVAPLLPLHLVEVFGATESFIALYGLVELIAGASIALVTSTLVARFGNRNLITLSMAGTALSMSVQALAPSLEFTLIASALSGASWTAAGIGLFGFFSETTPQEDMMGYTNAYHQIIFLALFVGPLIGSALASADMNLLAVLIAGAVLRLISAALTQVEVIQVDEPDKPTL